MRDRHHGPAERRRAHARGGGGAGVGPGGRVGLVVSRTISLPSGLHSFQDDYCHHCCHLGC
eukprot:COSAG01_NODE_50122_length_366_cov_0.655431_1_plen_60_part_01